MPNVTRDQIKFHADEIVEFLFVWVFFFRRKKGGNTSVQHANVPNKHQKLMDISKKNSVQEYSVYPDLKLK